MFYREAGDFKTSYGADNQTFPISQDRYAYWALMAVAVAVVLPDHRRGEFDTWEDPQMPADTRLGVVYEDIAVVARRELPNVEIVVWNSNHPRWGASGCAPAPGSEVIAAKPTADLDADWGGGFLQPDVWVGVVYDGYKQ